MSSEQKRQQQTLGNSPVLVIRPYIPESRKVPISQMEKEQLRLSGNIKYSFWVSVSSVSCYNKPILTSPTTQGANYSPDAGERLSKTSLLPWEAQADRGTGAPEDSPCCRAASSWWCCFKCLPRATEGIFPLGIFSLPPSTLPLRVAQKHDSQLGHLAVTLFTNSSTVPWVPRSSFELYSSPLRGHWHVMGFITEYRIIVNNPTVFQILERFYNTSPRCTSNLCMVSELTTHDGQAGPYWNCSNWLFSPTWISLILFWVASSPIP